MTADGKEVPYQIGEADGNPVVWAAASLGPDEAIDYAVSAAARGRPSRTVRRTAKAAR